MSKYTAIRLHQAIAAIPLAITGVSIGTDGVKSTYTVRPVSLQTAAQATIDAFDDSAAGDAAYLVAQARADGIAGYAGSAQGLNILLRAVALVILDEINILRSAASLPPRTASQIKTAIGNKINGGTADSQ